MVNIKHQGRGLTGLYLLLLLAGVSLTPTNADEGEEAKCGRVKSGQDTIVAIGSHGASDFVIVLNTGEIYLLPRTAIESPDGFPRFRLTGSPIKTKLSIDVKNRRYCVLNYHDDMRQRKLMSAFVEADLSSFSQVSLKVYDLVALSPTGADVPFKEEYGFPHIAGVRALISSLAYPGRPVTAGDQIGQYWSTTAEDDAKSRKPLRYGGNVFQARYGDQDGIEMLPDGELDAYNWTRSNVTIAPVDGRYPLSGAIIYYTNQFILIYPDAGKVAYMNLTTTQAEAHKLVSMSPGWPLVAPLADVILCGSEVAKPFAGGEAGGGDNGGGGAGSPKNGKSTRIIIGVVLAIAVLALIGAIVYVRHRKRRTGSYRLASGARAGAGAGSAKSKVQLLKYRSMTGATNKSIAAPAISTGGPMGGGGPSSGAGGRSTNATASSQTGGSSRSGSAATTGPSIFSGAISGKPKKKTTANK